jgi:hypothetical protein
MFPEELMPLSRLLTVPAAALSLAATAASALAEVAQLVARRLSVQGNGQESVEAVRDTAAAIRQETLAAPQQARELVEAAPGLAELSEGAEAAASLRHARTRGFAVERVTDQPAKQVIAALETLSSIELSQVYEHESDNRRRKTVLRAIEQHVLPPDPARDEPVPEEAARAELRIDSPDITLPSETVHSTETPS